MSHITVHHGDCLHIMAGLPADSVDAIVTDPPYEIGFMGKGWDSAGVAFDPNTWRAALRILKPGGHLLAFGATRTYHRIAVAIEDAGFEIRDSLHWIYGTGFPKSLDVAKAIDKDAGHWRGRAGDVISSNGAMEGPNRERTDKGAPITEAAAAWEGWGTALKPAHEPVIVARKPLAGTVAHNVQTHGTGALNIDACRVGTTVETWPTSRGPNTGTSMAGGVMADTDTGEAPAGRWPANVILDTEAAAVLDAQSGTSKSRAGNPRTGVSGEGWGLTATGAEYTDNGGASRFFTVLDHEPPFRYVPKPSTAERNAGIEGPNVDRLAATGRENRDPDARGLESPRGGAGRTGANRNPHPTVKPIALMRWLIRLVTPPDGLVLDPFAGSGTTLIAAHQEGFDAIGCELTAQYIPVIEQRVRHHGADVTVLAPRLAEALDLW